MGAKSGGEKLRKSEWPARILCSTGNSPLQFWVLTHPHVQASLGAHGASLQLRQDSASAIELASGRHLDGLVIDCDDGPGGTKALPELRSTPANKQALILAVVNGWTSPEPGSRSRSRLRTEQTDSADSIADGATLSGSLRYQRKVNVVRQITAHPMALSHTICSGRWRRSELGTPFATGDIFVYKTILI